MADLLQWHNREAKSEWWLYFERRDNYADVDFIADNETLGGLSLVGAVGTEEKPTIWRYRFDPSQDHKFREGESPLDPATQKSAGKIVALDPIEGTLDLKRGSTSAAPHPTALMPAGPLETNEQENSLQRIARALLAYGTDGPGPARTARRLLGRHRPRFIGSHPSRPELRDPSLALPDNLEELIGSLDESVLPIQGPPGTGKTYNAARAILRLIGNGRRVAISAHTHSAIRNLLEECVRAAEEAGQVISIVQKARSGEALDHPWVKVGGTNESVAKSVGQVDIIAGTAWLFSRESMIDCADVLVVDEAGQLSLANVVAIAPAASNLVLVGDPQQLAQPSKVAHPGDAGGSALQHLLGGRDTVDAASGVLLDETRRLHPKICSFISEQFYDNLLASYPTCSNQQLTAGRFRNEAGIKYLPVPHSGNRTSSAEEAQAVAQLIAELIGGTWTDDQKVTQQITVDDILVVTPYNAQCAELARQLPGGVRIGTVDKFQGRQAAVTIVSMASSTADDAPRGMEFLFSRNRLNVAVSRAKVMAVLVANPGLPVAKCNSIEQIRLVNSLCRYVELADRLD